MLGARGCVASYALCFLVIQVKLSNSRTSWRLNADKVVKISAPQDTASMQPIPEDDPILDILTGSTSLDNGQGWSRSAAPSSTTVDKLQVYCNECKGYVNSGVQDRRFPAYGSTNVTEQNFGLGVAASSNQQHSHHLSCGPTALSCDDIVLDCGKPVNFTYYDNLLGISNRNKHPLVPEPDVAYMFLKPEEKLADFDIDLLERRLKKAKREKPKSVQIYNQIGNFWRIKGNALRSIECFRRALAVSPHNAEVLLNLARVLMVLEYLDDATHLARRSLELQPPDRSAWEQYLTLGQIYKAYGHFQESAAHLRQALDLKPGQEEVVKALKEVETLPIASIHVWTLVIIVLL
ncbi:tetratricopeptide repeat protein 17 isoform X2 [Copidosoma floridanum]|nr:tetratricopeptide repeat protein 17 isoform X2 [Copidosoma floridanum]